jgi:PAS domain S-box-containing protein
LKILAVDDDLNIREMIYQMLSLLGYNCKTAANVKEALHFLQQEDFSIVISDVRMPGIDGIELLKEIKSTYPDISVISITGYSHDYTFMDMINAGASDFILKPFSKDELEAKVNRIIREKELKEKEHLMALFAELDPAPSFRVDRHGIILMANQSANELFCSNSTSIIGMDLPSILPCIEKSNLTDCIRNGTLISQSKYIDNRFFHFIVKGISELKIAHIYGMDITEHKSVQDELKETKDYSENIIESSLDAIVVSDSKGYILKANRAFMEMIGYTEGEVLAKHITEFSIDKSGNYESTTGEIVSLDWGLFSHSDKEDQPAFPEAKNTSNKESYFLRKDHKVVPTEINTSYLYNHHNEITGSVAIIRNITERKRDEEELKRYRTQLEELVDQRTAELKTSNIQLKQENAERTKTEEALLKSEKRFRDLVENSLVGICIIQDKQILYQNPEQKRIFGPLSQSFSFTDNKHFHPDDIEKVAQFHQNIMAGTENALDLDFRFYIDASSSNGAEMRWVNCQASAIEYQGENAILVNMLDVTRHKELEHMVNIKNKMTSLGRVAAGIAHELRNPLSGINIYLTTLERLYANIRNLESKDIEKGKKIIEQLRSASDRIESVVRRVMDFSKTTVPQLSLVDINLSLEEVIKLSTVTLRKDGIALETSLDQDLPKCFADFRMLEQVFLNLLTNASQVMKDMNGPKTIEIASSKSYNFCQITFSDSGPGVPANIRDKIFDPFYTTKSNGFGIGLSISHRIITDHGGTLILSESKLGGAMFRIDIPIEKRKKKR